LVLLFEKSDGFPAQYKKAAKQYKIKAKKGKVIISDPEIKAGTYAVSCLHDENLNYEADTNWLGIPSEGIGFSNNPKIIFSKPSFEECIFKVNDDKHKINIKMKYF